MDQATTLKKSFDIDHDTQGLFNNDSEDKCGNDTSKNCSMDEVSPVRMGVFKTLILAQFISRGFVILNDALFSVPKQLVLTHFKKFVDNIEEVMKEFRWDMTTFDQIMGDLISLWIENPIVTKDKDFMKQSILAAIESHQSQVEAEGICETILQEKDHEIVCHCSNNYFCTKCYPNLSK